MVLPTHVTCVYTVNSAGKTPAQLATLMQAPAADPQMLALTGATLNTDTTLAGAGKVTRTIVLNITPAYDDNFPPSSDQTAPFWSFMTNILQKACGSPVIAAAPLLS